jgi:CO dehydrogenase/acetyl-CoA synthase beta subunit
LEPFDVYIDKLGKYLGNVGKKRQVREIECPTEVTQLIEGLPVRIGPQGGANIILKEDTAVELGNPSVASCAFLLWTPNLHLVRDGRITLIGPDIQEAVEESLPFAQVLIVGGTELKDQHHLVLEQHYIISNQIEGYMIRLAPQRQRMWTRVSKKAVEKGFSFETLGRAIMALYKSELPVIEATEVIFLTSSKEDVKGLENIATEVQKIKNDALSSGFVRKDDGSYECTSGYVDCRDCPDQVICDDIRDLIRLRRKERATGPKRLSQP